MKKSVLAVGVLAALGLAGCTSSAAASLTSDGAVRTISVVAHQTDLIFVTAAGSSSQYPRGPLSPGDRILGRDELLQNGSTIGNDFEDCTVSFRLHVLCDDMVEVNNVGDLHLTWMFQWPNSGTTGPTQWDGVVDGGTDAYANAVGDYHAQALPNEDDSITLRIVEPS
jgi:hypothetical protein